VAMAHGPAAGLALLDEISGLDDYYLYHSTRADLLSRLGLPASSHYERALALAPTEVERAFLRRRQDLLPPEL
jgi:RNA polymerase sigma-70 factor, ECF subfamily